MAHDLIPAVSGIISALIALAGLLIVNEFNKRSYVRLQNEDQRKEILNQLDTFYGPFQQLLAKRKALYSRFTYGKDKQFQDKPEALTDDGRFSTLLALLGGCKFEGNDDALLQEIIKVTNDLDNLISSKSGLVSDPDLRALLAQASAHFTYMRLAKDQKLKADRDRFSASVYPQGLNAVIDAKTAELQSQLDQLNGITRQTSTPPIVTQASTGDGTLKASYSPSPISEEVGKPQGINRGNQP